MRIRGAGELTRLGSSPENPTSKYMFVSYDIRESQGVRTETKTLICDTSPRPSRLRISPIAIPPMLSSFFGEVTGTLATQAAKARTEERKSFIVAASMV